MTRCSDASRPVLRRRLVAAATAAALTVALAGCGGSDSSDGDAASATTAAADAAGASDTTAKDASAKDAPADKPNPCSVVTQQQWETFFGTGVTKGDASGGRDNCNVLTKGTSPGHEVSFVNFSANLPNTTYDGQLGFNPSCNDAPSKTITGVGDKAVVDTSCLKLAGRAWVITEAGGDVIGVFVESMDGTKADAAAVESALVRVATDALAAR